ncbi:hypothetical protein [Snodgrassella communis]|uniref:hypothetical protein n=1 Tax=Snodgrassella communis TaxID=2946699 RepID=UPI001EF6B60B|nr:hypothetical protein [Snodgrassella communis]
MSAKSKEIKKIIEEYLEEKGIKDGIIDPHDLAGWAISNGKYKPNIQDEIQIAAKSITQVMREEIRTSPSGKRYRAMHAVKEKINGKQLALWGDLDNPETPIEFFIKSFAQRRQQIVGDCFQLKTDVDVCNEKRNSNIQLILDFADDVAEAEYLRDHKDDVA